MGGLVPDPHVAGLLDLCNLRFAPDFAIKEMIALQNEFNIFSEEHSLKEAFQLLNLAPLRNWRDRRGWYRYLESLRNVPPGGRQTAHDRIIKALKDHLERQRGNKEPQPVFFTSHSSVQNPDVVIRAGDTPLSYSIQDFLTISLPMTPVERRREKRRSANR